MLTGLAWQCIEASARQGRVSIVAVCSNLADTHKQLESHINMSHMCAQGTTCPAAAAASSARTCTQMHKLQQATAASPQQYPPGRASCAVPHSRSMAQEVACSARTAGSLSMLLRTPHESAPPPSLEALDLQQQRHQQPNLHPHCCLCCCPQHAPDMGVCCLQPAEQAYIGSCLGFVHVAACAA